jgi:hypothetical protein
MYVMNHRFSIPSIVSMLLLFVSCSSQETVKEQTETPTEAVESVDSKKTEPHRYGGWYCPDNFGFVPVDIQELDAVPAIANRLPTEEELQNNMSLIKVDTALYPDARALEMDLPRVAKVYSAGKGMNELIIVIQAIVVQEDTVVGYRFANGGNGSAWLSDVTFLSDDEVAAMGAQPFFYSKSVLKAKTADIWNAMGKTDYFKELGEKFDRKKFFSSKYNAEDQAHLNLDTDGEKAKGYAGMVFGNYYLQIDYDRGGSHYSEKLLMIENQDDHTTELFFASGPYPEGFEKEKATWDSWIEEVTKASEAE